MDEVDTANNYMYETERRNVDFIRNKAQNPLPTSKVCLWCGDRTKKGARWCNADCRDFYLKEFQK